MSATGIRRPVWNCTALIAASRTPRSRERRRAATPSSWLSSKTATGSQWIASPKRSAARCQGDTFAGNSPSSRRIASPGSHGMQRATSVTPRVVLGTKATSDAAAPTSEASLPRNRSRWASHWGRAETPRLR